MAATKIAASTGVSSLRNGRNAALGIVRPIASKCSQQFQRVIRTSDPDRMRIVQSGFEKKDLRELAAA